MGAARHRKPFPHTPSRVGVLVLVVSDQATLRMAQLDDRYPELYPTLSHRCSAPSLAVDQPDDRG